MVQSEYRLLIDQPGPNSDPVPRIVTRSRIPPRSQRKSLTRHLWEIGMGFLPALSLVIFFATWTALHRPPVSYALAVQATPQPELRPQLINALEQNTTAILDRSDEDRAEDWSVEFTQIQLNSWLADRFPQLEGEWEELGLREPRLFITPRSIDLGVQVDQGGEEQFWSISFLPQVKGPRQLTLRVIGVKVGLVPIPLNQIRLEPQGILHGEDWQIAWSYSKSENLLTLDLPESSGIPPLSAVEVLAETICFKGTGALDQKPQPENTPPTPPQPEPSPPPTASPENTSPISTSPENTLANPGASTPLEPGK